MRSIAHSTSFTDMYTVLQKNTQETTGDSLVKVHTLTDQLVTVFLSRSSL